MDARTTHGDILLWLLSATLMALSVWVALA